VRNLFKTISINELTIFLCFFSLAASGLLYKKATVPSLRQWLKDNSIAVKAKTKKEELVHMILTKLGYGGGTSEQ
jgi:hypothetical protein